MVKDIIVNLSVTKEGSVVGNTPFQPRPRWKPI